MNIFKEVHLPGLETAYLGKRFLYFDEISSTNTFLKENAVNLPHGATCAAALQTAGRGRMGRDWSNLKSRGLMFSFLLHGFEPAIMAALPLAVGLGVSLAVKKLCGIDAPLKWSNDVLFQEKKLAGVLCESRIKAGGGFAVAGIGLNLSYTREALDSLGLVYATSLFLATQKKYGEFDCAAAILNEMEPVIEKYRNSGLGAIKDDYEKRCCTLGRDICIFSPDGGRKEARAVGIGDDGSLLCSAGGRVFSVTAGEATIRDMW